MPSMVLLFTDVFYSITVSSKEKYVILIDLLRYLNLNFLTFKVKWHICALLWPAEKIVF